MTDFMGVFIAGIITWGIYNLFELFAHRKERLKIIEKLDFGHPDKNFDINIFSSATKPGNLALRFSMLLMGLGLGLLVGFIIHMFYYEYIRQYTDWELKSVIYVSCILLFGGAGLMGAYLIERKQNKQNK